MLVSAVPYKKVYKQTLLEKRALKAFTNLSPVMKGAVVAGGVGVAGLSAWGVGKAMQPKVPINGPIGQQQFPGQVVDPNLHQSQTAQQNIMGQNQATAVMPSTQPTQAQSQASQGIQTQPPANGQLQGNTNLQTKTVGSQQFQSFPPPPIN